MIGVFITVAVLGLFWLAYRRPYRRRWLLPRPAKPESPVPPAGVVDRQHRHLLAGGWVGEVAVATAAARFAELLGAGRSRDVERELQPGVGFAVNVRALARVGTPAAGRVLERQLDRRLTPDPVEQAWYWADVAAGLRQLHHSTALPGVLRCADAAAATLPAGVVLAVEALAFPNFPSTLNDLTSPLGGAALRAIATVARGCRERLLDPATALRVGLGDLLAALSETAPTAADPHLTMALLEAERLFRRVAGWAKHLRGDDRSVAERCGLRLLRSARQRATWLAEAAPRLLRRFAHAPADIRVALLRCLCELRAEVASLFPNLPDRRAVWWLQAVACLTWSKSPRIGPQLVGQAARWLSCRRDRSAAVPLLAALRGHPNRNAEALLVEVAATDRKLRPVALGSLGWWPPYDPHAVLRTLRMARTDPDGPTRHAAVAALARLGDRGALAELQAGLKTEETAVRFATIDRIANEQISWLWPDLQELADGQDADAGLVAVEAVERLREGVLGPLG